MNRYYKKYETVEFPNSVYAVCDKTDHFAFICKQCVIPVNVIGIITDKIKANISGSQVYIKLKCPKCSVLSHRKMYYSSETNKFMQYEAL